MTIWYGNLMPWAWNICIWITAMICSFPHAKRCPMSSMYIISLNPHIVLRDCCQQPLLSPGLETPDIHNMLPLDLFLTEKRSQCLSLTFKFPMFSPLEHWKLGSSLERWELWWSNRILLPNIPILTQRMVTIGTSHAVSGLFVETSNQIKHWNVFLKSYKIYELKNYFIPFVSST